MPLNCGGLPESLAESELFGHEPGAFTGANRVRVGKFEYAHGGTLFLDEIESMPMAVQIKLLRALQERSIERIGSNKAIPFDCRVVAASKDDLKELSDRQKFRADLYYRIGVAFIELPPLRERREDIPLLFEHFTLLAAGRYERAAPVAEQRPTGGPDGLCVAGKRTRVAQRGRPFCARSAGRAPDTSATDAMRPCRKGCSSRSNPSSAPSSSRRCASTMATNRPPLPRFLLRARRYSTSFVNLASPRNSSSDRDGLREQTIVSIQATTKCRMRVPIQSTPSGVPCARPVPRLWRFLQ